MAIPQGFQKARLEIDGGDSIECAFNPQSYTVSKTNVWTYKPTQGSDLPAPEFGGGMPMTYKLALLLDTSLQGPDASVKDDANKLMQAMHGNGSAPRFITFTWGSVKLPKAAPMSLSIQYAMFHPNGEPVRAFVELELSQAEPTAPVGQAQNPTTRGNRGSAPHVVQGGRHAAVDRVRELSRSDQMAGDRRGQRNRRPTSRQARHHRSRSRGSTA